jgi:hypothetical protein
MFRFMPHHRLVMLLLAAAIATASGLVIPAVSQAANTIEITSLDGGKCLQPYNGSLGAPILQETCTASLAQQWTKTGSPTTLHFVNSSDGLCLDARGGDTQGTPIQQWTCDNISNENWWMGPYNDTLVSRVSGSWDECISMPGTETDIAAIELFSCDDYDNYSQLFYVPIVG